MGEEIDNPGSHGGVLSNHRRQLVLDQLQSHETMTVRDLAEQIAISDQQTDIEALSEEALQEVEVALHHVHVPKLADAGYVEYDSGRRLVSVTEAGRTATVERECDRARGVGENRITVEMCPSTIDGLHELIRRDDRLDPRMSYDEVVSVVVSSRLERHGQVEDGEQTSNP